jgi:hypothetical protein
MRLQDVSIKSLGAGLLGAGVLVVLLGTCGVVKAQDGQDEAKPPKQEEPKADEAKPRPQEAPKDVKPDQAPKKDDAKQTNGKDDAKPMGKQDNEMRAPEHPQDNHMQGGQANAASQRGQKIPDDKFRASFGRQHSFQVGKTVVVEGQSRFQYGGFWFALADPWPVGWAYTDDCYIDYVDGEYVLFDLLHPGVQIVVFVVV